MGVLYTLTLTSSVRDQGNADLMWTQVTAIMKKTSEAIAAEAKTRLPMGLKATVQEHVKRHLSRYRNRSNTCSRGAILAALSAGDMPI